MAVVLPNHSFFRADANKDIRQNKILLSILTLAKNIFLQLSLSCACQTPVTQMYTTEAGYFAVEQLT